jgi:hypothetical protein
VPSELMPQQHQRLLRHARPALLAVGVICLLTLAVYGLARPARTFAACGGVQSGQAKRHIARGLPPLAIGDSTMLLSLPALTADGFDVNARGCRQFPEALALLAALAQAHHLPHLVVIALGANGSVTAADVLTARHMLGPSRVLALLTPVQLGGGSGPNAATVRTAGRTDPGHIDVLDWVRRSSGHASWFQPDGLHLTLAGAAAFARLIATSLPFARQPPRTITVAATGAGPARVAVPTMSTWSVSSRRPAATAVQTPGRCGYRLALSASLGAASVGATGFSGPTTPTNPTGDTGGTGSGAGAVVAALMPDGSVLRASDVAPDVAWAMWRQAGARTIGGAWAANAPDGDAYLVLRAQGQIGRGCPGGTLRRAESAIARILAGTRPLEGAASAAAG